MNPMRIRETPMSKRPEMKYFRSKIDPSGASKHAPNDINNAPTIMNASTVPLRIKSGRSNHSDLSVDLFDSVI